jgi:hypothetical protein
MELIFQILMLQSITTPTWKVSIHLIAGSLYHSWFDLSAMKVSYKLITPTRPPTVLPASVVNLEWSAVFLVEAIPGTSGHLLTVEY